MMVMEVGSLEEECKRLAGFKNNQVFWLWNNRECLTSPIVAKYLWGFHKLNKKVKQKMVCGTQKIIRLYGKIIWMFLSSMTEKPTSFLWSMGKEDRRFQTGHWIRKSQLLNLSACYRILLVCMYPFVALLAPLNIHLYASRKQRKLKLSEPNRRSPKPELECSIPALLRTPILITSYGQVSNTLIQIGILIRRNAIGYQHAQLA